MDYQTMIAATAEAGFITDSHGRIVGWNSCAADLLGYTASQVLGKPCFETLRGCDVFGNRFCDANCPLRNMICRHEPLRHTKLCFTDADKDTVQVWVWPVVVPEEHSDDVALLHLLHAVGGNEEGRGVTADVTSNRCEPNPNNSVEQLTPRELEVLRLLTEGLSTNTIAERLFISSATVRNHVHHLLGKLDVGSRGEAIGIALRNNLV